MNHNIIPPPDVTHTTKMMPPLIVSSGASSLYSTKPNNVPPGILKDPKRNQQQNQLNNVNKDLTLMPMPSIAFADGLSNVATAHQLSAAQLMNSYDPTNNANVNLNLSNFNHAMGFPDGTVDGHLV